MSDTPEPLAAILADYRADIPAMTSGELPHPTPEYLRILLDRIEAAAERERDEDRQLAAIAESDEAFSRCARCDRPERAPGNAAAMREALEWVDRFFSYDGSGTSTDAAVLAIEASTKTREALSAPARNCDRIATLDEARRAFQDLRGHKILADVELWDSMDEAGALVRWLFAPAEGGAE